MYIVAPTFIVAGAVLLSRLPKAIGPLIGAIVLAVALVLNLGLLFQAHDRLVSKIACERPMTPIARGSAGNPC